MKIDSEREREKIILFKESIGDVVAETGCYSRIFHKSPSPCPLWRVGESRLFLPYLKNNYTDVSLEVNKGNLPKQSDAYVVFFSHDPIVEDIYYGEGC